MSSEEREGNWGVEGGSQSYVSRLNFACTELMVMHREGLAKPAPQKSLQYGREQTFMMVLSLRKFTHT